MHLFPSRIAFSIGLVGLGLLGATTALAETVQVHEVTSTRVQRAVADDPLVDESLVVHLAVAAAAAPTAAPAAPAKPAPAAEPAKPAASTDDKEAEYQIATLGPAMRPLHVPFSPRWPTSGIITTYFGEVGPLSPRGHAGLDIANDTGTPVLAADEGEVLKAYWDDAYGGLIVVAHPSGYETWYGHLSRIGVEKGDHVDKGGKIGLMGSTGYSTGPHLHFEVRQEGELRDPLSFLAESALKSNSN